MPALRKVAFITTLSRRQTWWLRYLLRQSDRTRLFRERGVEAVGLSELMKHAGFTQGGFYNHFETKADLVAEVLASAIVEGNADFANTAVAPVHEPTTALRRSISWYLSQAHRDDIDHGCPFAGFAGDAPGLRAE